MPCSDRDAALKTATPGNCGRRQRINHSSSRQQLAIGVRRKREVGLLRCARVGLIGSNHATRQIARRATSVLHGISVYLLLRR